MITKLQRIRVFAVMVGTVLAVTSHGRVLPHDPTPAHTTADSFQVQTLIGATQQASLTKEEADGLLFMREEEKLAHDVYSVLAEKWGSRPFGNIMQAEFAHTSWVSGLLKKYDVADPAERLGPGKFKDKTLQKLYDDLVKQGSISRLEALKAGATIEDVDLFDLERLAKTTNREDVKSVYDNLARSSRNHMRAFVRNLANSGVTYKPKYITQETFDQIIASPSERGGEAMNCMLGESEKANAVASVDKSRTTSTLYSATVALPTTRVVHFLEQEASLAGFKVTAQHNMQESLAKEGREVNPAMVVELCQPAVAFKALNELATFASVMPCRVAITEAEGLTTVSMILPTALASAITDRPEVQSMALAIEKDLVDILDKTTQRRPSLEQSWFDVNLPYKNALMASNKGEAVKSRRAIAQTMQQWKTLVESFSGSNHVLTADAGWQTMANQVLTALEQSEVQISSGEIANAHETLEKVRSIWAAYRDRHNQRNFTDALFYFHEEMEAAVNVPQEHDIVSASTNTLVGMKATWKAVLTSEIPALATDQAAARQSMMDDIGNSLEKIERHVVKKDAAEVRSALGTLKTTFVKLYMQFG